MDNREKLEEAKRLYKIANADQKYVLERLFPELWESKDDRIRKWLIEMIEELREANPTNIVYNGNCSDAIAWLEKQGEHAKFRDSIQVGDKVTRNQDGVLVNLSQLNRVAKKDEKQGEQKPMKTCAEYYNQDNELKMPELSEFQNKLADILMYREYDGPDETEDDIAKGRLEYELAAIRLSEELLPLAQKEQKLADKVEPKFQNGQWIVWQDKCYKVNDNGCGYELIDQNGLSTSLEYGTVDESAHVWDITKDAKDGDVLACESGWTCIFKTLVNDETFSSYCFMDKTKWFCEIGSECHTLNEVFVKAYNGKIHPATKEQRNLLFQKMKEADYEWDADKKELKKIEQKPTEDVDLPEFDSYLCLMFQKFRTKGMCTNGEIIDYVKEHSQKLRDILVKPTWSKEDERTFSRICGIIHHAAYQNCDTDEDGNELGEYAKIINWFKSLKDKVLPKQEWSEEDEYCTHQLIVFCKNCMQPDSGAIRCVHWLKSLKDRYTWKPSNEQMNTLDQWLKDNQYKGDARYCYPIFESLYQDLKKLKG